jgi:hypothetical protein
MRKSMKTWLIRGGTILIMSSFLFGMHLGNAGAATAAPDFVASNIRMLNVDGGNYIFVQVKNSGTAGVASTVGMKPLAVTLSINGGTAVIGYLQESSFPRGYTKELRFGPFNKLSTAESFSCSTSCSGAVTGNCTRTGTCLNCPAGYIMSPIGGGACGENSGANGNCGWEGSSNNGNAGWVAISCQKNVLYGNYSLTAKVDTENSYSEINEGNNTLIKTVAMPKPDFAVTNTRLTNENGSYYAYTSIKNYGGGVTASEKPLWVDVTIPGKASKSISLKDPFYNNAYTKELKVGPLDDISASTDIMECHSDCNGGMSGGCIQAGPCLNCPAGYTMTPTGGGACGNNSGAFGNCGWEGSDNNGNAGWVGIMCQKITYVDSISVKAMLDGNNYFEESTEQNNSMTKTLAVPKPDFTVSNVKLTNEEGQNYVRATIANAGDGVSSSMTGGTKKLVICATSQGGSNSIIGPYLNTGVAGTAGTAKMYCNSAIEPYYNNGFKADIRIPISGTLSEFLGTTSTVASISVTVDMDNMFREKNETNNKATSKVTIPTPDFTIGTITIKQEGTDYYAYAEIKNIGGGTSGLNGKSVKPLYTNAAISSTLGSVMELQLYG